MIEIYRVDVIMPSHDNGGFTRWFANRLDATSYAYMENRQRDRARVSTVQLSLTLDSVLALLNEATT